MANTRSLSNATALRDGNVLRVTLSADQKFRIRTPLRDVSPELIDATLKKSGHGDIAALEWPAAGRARGHRAVVLDEAPAPLDGASERRGERGRARRYEPDLRAFREGDSKRRLTVAVEGQPLRRARAPGVGAVRRPRRRLRRVEGDGELDEARLVHRHPRGDRRERHEGADGGRPHQLTRLRLHRRRRGGGSRKRRPCRGPCRCCP